MKIIADKNIPFLKGVAEEFGDVTYLSGADFNANTIHDADTLIVRTVAHFDEKILRNSNVKLICSATIGYDHIDTAYCDAHNIKWTNAPGCNSGSVQQYVVAALVTLSQNKNINLEGKTIGIVGVGNVGKKVAKACKLLGMNVLLNDPPRQAIEKTDEFVDLSVIQEKADFITFHTPLSKEGEYKTFHLADDHFFAHLAKRPYIINSARGSIIDTKAIKQAINKNEIAGAIIDCWEQEPNIDLEYLEMVDIATPHIAGYSRDGKANATKMSLESLAQYWGLSTKPIEAIIVPPATDPIIDYTNNTLYTILLKTYNPLSDMQLLLEDPSRFSQLRSEYPLRREYLAYKVENINKESKDYMILKSLGFSL